MIEWKDVNNELPKDNIDVLVTILSKKRNMYRVAHFYDSYPDEAWFQWNSRAYSTKSKFEACIDSKGKLSIFQKITHWAYINEPEVKDA